MRTARQQENQFSDISFFKRSRVSLAQHVEISSPNENEDYLSKSIRIRGLLYKTGHHTFKVCLFPMRSLIVP